MTNRNHVCKFCKKGFSSEKTLSAHMCKKKKRFHDKDIVSCRLGFRAYQTFYKMTTNAKKPKTIEDFINSKYYVSFVKFGRFLERDRPIMPEEYTKYVITNSVRLDDWTKDRVYKKYLLDYIKKEPAATALERTITFLEDWAKENNTTYNEFFRTANANEIAFFITVGKISPWVLYLSDTSDTVFEMFNEEHSKMVKDFIDPAVWQKIFSKKEEDVDFVRDILHRAGI